MRLIVNRSSAEISGIIRIFGTTEFLICLSIFDRILPLVHIAHKALQSETATINSAGYVVNSVLTEIRKMRSDDSWNTISNAFQELRQSVPENPDAHPKRFKPNPSLSQASCYLGQRDTEAESHNYDSQKISIFFPIIDRLTSEIERRFNKETMDLAAAVDGVLNCESGRAAPLLEQYAELLHIDRQLVLVEMDVAKNLLPLGCLKPIDYLKSFVLPSSYPNFYKLLQVALAIPIGSSKCERSISAMRRVRNYMRTTMGQDRFTQLCMLTIERDLVSQLNVTDLIDTFAENKNRRLVLT
jgi:hypothetical protein